MKPRVSPFTSVLAVIAVAFLVMPLVALVMRAPWMKVPAILSDPDVGDAVRLSMVSSLMAMLVALVLGGPLAVVIVRWRSKARFLVRGLALLPLVLPPVVGGTSLLLAFGKNGFFGQLLGLRLFGTTAAVVIAEAFVALPLVVLTLESGLRSYDRRFEDVALALGARPMRRMWSVTLPLLSPAIASAAVLAWARALGEFGATITFAGNVPGVTRTLPLAVFVELQRDLDSAIALSLILVAISLTVLVALRDRWVPQG